MKEHILIAYYSQSGNTKHIAELISRQTDGILYEITPERPYKSLYLGGGTRIKKERQSGELPELKLPLPDLSQYDIVFLGTPNWGNSLAHPVLTLLGQLDFFGKIILPFCTHGGGGSGQIESDLKRLCPGANVKPIFETYGRGGVSADQDIANWIGGVLE